MRKEKQVTKAIVKKEQAAVGRPLEPWEEELRGSASTEKAQETLGVPRISTRGGVLKVDGKKPVEGNKLTLAVVDYVYEKRFNLDKFDPTDTKPPDCYAQARPLPGDKAGDTEARMVAHTAAPLKQNVQADGTSPCKGCKWNAFGTAEVGRGKRCKDYRKLLVFSPRIDERGKATVDEDAVQRGMLYQMDVPPSGLKDFGVFYSSLDALTRTGNIREAIIEVGLEALENGGHKPTFQFVAPVSSEGLKAIVALGRQKGDALMQPWPVRADEKPKEPEKPLKGQSKRR